jgi:hypothetical protein
MLRNPLSTPVWETPNINCIVPAFFEDRFEGKDGGLCTHNPHAEEVGRFNFYTKRLRAGIFKKSMGAGARHRVGIGLSYRPARLHRLAELMPWK